MEILYYSILILLIIFLIFLVIKTKKELFNSYKYNLKLELELEKLKSEKKVSINQYSKKVRLLESSLDKYKSNNKPETTKPIKVTLDKENTSIYNYMIEQNNMFISGYINNKKNLFHYYINTSDKNVLITSFSVKDSISNSCVTLDSIFDFKNTDEIKLSPRKNKLLRKIDVLIINQISLVRVDMFDIIDRTLKLANKNDLPFGGKQIILFGDLFDSRPSYSEAEYNYLVNAYGGIYFFNLSSYKDANIKYIELKNNNGEISSILNDYKNGLVTTSDIKKLNERYNPLIPKKTIQIVSSENESLKINLENYDKLKSKEFIYKANILLGEKNIKESDYLCDFNLKLKIGSLVMVIDNDKGCRVGSIGIVNKLSDEEIVVNIEDKVYSFNRCIYNKYKCEYNSELEKIEYIKTSSVEQFPLILAYSIDTSSITNMTYKLVACNLDETNLYTILSRCEEFKRLYLMSRVSEDTFRYNPEVISYYKELKNNL